MSLSTLWHSLRSLAGACVAGLGLALLPTGDAFAQDDPPGRVGRLVDFQGGVFWFDPDDGRWADAERNRPLTAGDRLATAGDGRAELRVGSTTLRLGEGSELEVVQLDDERMAFQLHAGQLALRVRSNVVAREIEVATPEARLRPTRSGHYRIDRVDDTTFAGVWRGELQLDDAQGFSIVGGQRAELIRDPRTSALRATWGEMPGDGFGRWAVAADQRDDQRSASQRYVSPEMTGVEELDAYGRWDNHPEYGAIWYPLQLQVGWAPYRYGRWVWVRPWGWTWIDDARWGFAPFHYGRWVSWGGRWGWVPGPYVVRPVFAPALVAWVGGVNWSVGVQIGSPPIGWVPLAPREAYVPWYRHTPRYGDRVNAYIHPRPPAPRPQPGRPGTAPPRPSAPPPIMYTNAGVPGGVTVVPRDVLVDRRPVGRSVVDVPIPRGRTPGGAPDLIGVAPPSRPLPPARGASDEPPRAPPRIGPPATMVRPVPGGTPPLPPAAEPRGGTREGPGPAMPRPAVPPTVVPAPMPRDRSGDPGVRVPPPAVRDPRAGGEPRSAPPPSTPERGATPDRRGGVVPVPPRAPNSSAPPPPARPVPAPGARTAPAAPPAAAPPARPAPPARTVPVPPPRPPARSEDRAPEEGRKRIPEPRPPSRATEATR